MVPSALSLLSPASPSSSNLSPLKPPLPNDPASSTSSSSSSDSSVPTPPSPVVSEDSETHARRRAEKFGVTGLDVELPRRDDEDADAQLAAVKAHLRRKRRNRSLFLSPHFSKPSVVTPASTFVPPEHAPSALPAPPPEAQRTTEPSASSPLSSTATKPVTRRPRRNSTLTAAQDIPWSPPSPLQTCEKEHSKVSVKVRRALSLLAHGDGHHHRQHSLTDPNQRQGSIDGLSRRESKRREKAEVGSTGEGVLFREVFVDSPREEYFGRRESILRNLRAMSTSGAGSSRHGPGSTTQRTAPGTIGEEPELEGRLDRFDSRLTDKSTTSLTGASIHDIQRRNTPVRSSSMRWKGAANPFSEGGPTGFPASAMGSPRPSMTASPRPSFMSSVYPPDEEPRGSGGLGSVNMTPSASRNGGGHGLPTEGFSMTSLSPPQANSHRHRQPASPPSRPGSPSSVESNGRMSPNGHTLLLPPIHLSAPTPTKEATSTPTAFPITSPKLGDTDWGARPSLPEEFLRPMPYSHGGSVPNGHGGRWTHSPSMSLESLFTPPGQPSSLPLTHHVQPQYAESSSAARRRALASLDTTYAQTNLLGPTSWGAGATGGEGSRMGGSVLGSEMGGSALDLLSQSSVDGRNRSATRLTRMDSARPESPVRRADTMDLGQESGEVVWERLWENQRGILFFGTPRFSGRMLLPNEPGMYTRPGLTKDGCKTPYNLRNYQLPDGTWEWASEWMVNMRRDGETDEKGWEYNSWFKRRGWHAVLPWHGYQGWVRRREWIRLRVHRQTTDVMTEAHSEHALSRSRTPLSNLLSRSNSASSSELSAVSPVFMQAATLQRWHYEQLQLDEAVKVLSGFRWDVERLQMWKRWLEEGDGGILGLRSLVEHHFVPLVATFNNPFSRLKLQELIKNTHPDWTCVPPPWN